jgi:uncharacterized protein (TIGR02118 family)
MLRLTVLYPAGDGATFDWDYYTSQHMALVQDKFGDWMAREPEVTRGLGAVPKGDATYQCTAAMYFASKDDLDAAFRNAGTAIPEDIPKFTNVQPIMQLDEVV